MSNLAVSRETPYDRETTLRPDLDGASEKKGSPMSPSEANPSFAEVYTALQADGHANVVSTKDTKYRVTAGFVGNRRAIIAKPKSSQITIHEDCWNQAKTCAGTRAGGVYNGNPSIYDWYAARR
jgi:hypothetical protein